MNLFVNGPFRAHSGSILQFKIECDALAEDDFEALAAHVNRLFIPFKAVYGIPRGGVRFERALQRYATNSEFDPLLIVDDVLTTGASMDEARERVGPNSFGIVIFARGPCPDWVTPLFTVNRAE